MTTRLQRRLLQARTEQRGLLMGFLPSGYPSPEEFRAAAGAAFDAGLDALEVSMPGPAPGLDGPLIQEAAARAFEHVRTAPDALRLAAESRRHPDDVIVALAYARTFDELSHEQFLDELVRADVDAVLLPQHPVSDQLALGRKSKERGIEPILFLHLQQDLALIAATDLEHPVIYLQSADLRTGGAFLPEKAHERLGELAAALGSTPYSVLVGFGIRGYDEVASVMVAGADGAVIGTRLVVAAGEGPDAVREVIDEAATPLVRRETLR